MTRWSLTFLLVALTSLGGLIGGFLAFVNWFSETGRGGGDTVLVAIWASGLLGVVATIAFGVCAWSKPDA